MQTRPSFVTDLEGEYTKVWQISVDRRCLDVNYSGSGGGTIEVRGYPGERGGGGSRCLRETLTGSEGETRRYRPQVYQQMTEGSFLHLPAEQDETEHRVR